MKEEFEIGFFGLEHKDGGYFFTLVSNKTYCSCAVVKAETKQLLYDIALSLNIKNIENIDLEKHNIKRY